MGVLRRVGEIPTGIFENKMRSGIFLEGTPFWVTLLADLPSHTGNAFLPWGGASKPEARIGIVDMGK